MKVKHLAVILTLISVPLIWAQDRVDFSGSWKLNAEKSDLGSMGQGRRGGRMGGEMTVIQKGDSLTVKSSRPGRDGEMREMVQVYILNGEEVESGTASRSTLSVAEWSEDGSKLTIVSETVFSRNGNEMVMESEAVWTLEDGCLKIVTERSSPRGDVTTTMIYDKQ